MLVLSARLNEKIFIGEGDNQLTLIVSKIGPEVVRLGFDAPRSVKVMRNKAMDKELSRLATEATDDNGGKQADREVGEFRETKEGVSE